MAAPMEQLSPVALLDRGSVTRISGRAWVAGVLPIKVNSLASWRFLATAFCIALDRTSSDERRRSDVKKGVRRDSDRNQRREGSAECGDRQREWDLSSGRDVHWLSIGRRRVGTERSQWRSRGQTSCRDAVRQPQTRRMR